MLKTVLNKFNSWVTQKLYNGNLAEQLHRSDFDSEISLINPANVPKMAFSISLDVAGIP